MTPFLTRIGSGALALVFTSCTALSGCVTAKYEAKADAPQPAPKTAVVDFTPLFSLGGLSRSVYTKPLEPGLMDRVLLSPNLVFESSRSSLDEPSTVGPVPVPGSPDLLNALGRAVNISESSTLMGYLAGKGSVLIAPAVTRRWSWSLEWWCTPNCPRATWVERVLLMNTKLVRPPAKDTEKAVVLPPQPDDTRGAPSSMLAVRDLGSSARTVNVVVELAPTKGGSSQLVVRARRSPEEPSLCPGMQLDVPLVWFSAEVLSMTDGRILARIDEQRMPKLEGQFRFTIHVATLEAVREVDQPPQDQPVWIAASSAAEPATREYVSRWNEVDATCPEVLHAYASAIKSLGGQLADREIVLEVVRTSLDPLYR